MREWAFRVIGRRLLSTNRVLRQDVLKDHVEIDPSEMYQRLSPVEHVLARPEVYIGSTEPVPRTMWIPSKVEDDTWRVHARQVQVVPAFAKIFDEIIVNAADNYQRDKSTKNIDVEVDTAESRITITNNGRGPPVTLHKAEDVYIPELVFGTLLTGSNFSDASDVERTTAGRHGYGAKLTNIMSTHFSVETWDAQRKVHFSQVWTNNMRNTDQPVITDAFDAENLTRVEFRPDLERFGMESLDPDSLAFMMKRTWDTAACLADKGVSVTWNGKRVPFQSFEEYLRLHGDATAGEGLILGATEKYQYGIRCLTSAEKRSPPPPVSFVNGVATYRGGTHVHLLADAVQKSLQPALDGVLKREHLNHNLLFCANAIVNKPHFESQSKEMLTTRSAELANSLKVDDEFLTTVQGSAEIVSTIQRHMNKAVWKLLIPKKRALAHLNLPKLDDALEAGRERRSECTLILTEGDSAKALAVAGLSVVGRDLFGVYPIRGKLLNVRDVSPISVAENSDVAAIVKILGLKFGMEYGTPEERARLRYGKLMLMTDQDNDGHHIKGLIINLFHHFWPSLIENDGFLTSFRTPVVRVRSPLLPEGRKSFYYTKDMEDWLETLSKKERKSLVFKYYKGLGTSTTEEAKEYFSEFEKHTVPFRWDNESANSIDMVFRKNRVEERRAWSKQFTEREEGAESLSYASFLDTDVADFSRMSQERSIPHVTDGLKKSQRKVLFSSLKKCNTTSEIKIPQLSGYAAELTSYHHGDLPLQQTIIQMAQDFVGSNNIPLLIGVGQFGTRLRGGLDAASPRYLFVKLSPLARKIFRPEDDNVLDYCVEDGQQVEPVSYRPIIPMALVNGCSGVATGYCTNFPSYNPLDIIRNIERHLDGEKIQAMTPWFRGFLGTVERFSTARATGTRDKYKTTGVIRMSSGKSRNLRIHELPVGKWTEPYREKLIQMEEKSTFVKKFQEHFTDRRAQFEVKLTAKARALLFPNQAVEKFELERVLPNRFYLLDFRGNVRSYRGTSDILADFLVARKRLYIKRKEDQIEKITKQCERLETEYRFLELVNTGEIDFCNSSFDQVLTKLREHGFKRDGVNNNYDYLVKTPLVNLTDEKASRVKQSLEQARKEKLELEDTDPTTMYRRDLEELRQAILDESKPGGCLHTYTREEMLATAGPPIQPPEKLSHPKFMNKRQLQTYRFRLKMQAKKNKSNASLQNSLKLAREIEKRCLQEKIVTTKTEQTST